MKIAAGQRGNWDTSIGEVGQRAGIFKKHGIESVGYWMPADPKDERLHFLLRYPSKEAREAAGIGEGLLRVSVGLESLADVKADLARGLG